ncbi:MAG: hydrogen peroxide-inducible genes activator [Myxococcales bacterium]|jgi:LysR family hydrogen peroxide-inducible transcriptional activator|nr:hydrogen peroxide-inducible genes activator [Myxococcales bacterium]
MDLTQVTLTQMRYAVAVAETRSFRLASERCHVSQSGLSMQIQKLEDLLGAVLFDRRKKPVLPTKEGDAAIAQMRVILRETERLGQILAEEDAPSGPFRLGVIPTMSSTVLPLFLHPFVEANPRVDLVIEELKTEEIIARLHADTLEAGLAATPLAETGLVEEPLALEPLYAYLPPGDPLLRKRRLTQADLSARELWVMPEGHCFRSQVLSYCGAEEAIAPGRVKFESGSFETLIQLVDGGMGATIVPALVVRALSPEKKEAQVRPLVAPTPVREIGLVTARTDFRRRIFEALAKTIRECLAPALGREPRRSLVLDPRA